MKTKRTLSTLARRAKPTLLLATLIGLVGASPMSLQAATVSELLEQGIYSEETKGDIDAAMDLYQQVVEEAKAGESLAAQAQYRLGVCYWKKSDYPKASAAFERLVEVYPDQVELVRLASEYLAGAVDLLPAPWRDREELQLSIKTATGMEVGYVRYSVYSDMLDGRKIWRLNSRLVAGPKQVSRVAVDAESFKPLHSHWKHSMFGEADTTYSAGRAEVTLTGKDEVQTADLTGVYYDNEEVIQLIRRLPLAPDYVTTLRVFTGLGGARILPIEAKVTSLETVKVPAGTFDCYKVQMSLVNQTFWYSNDDHRYLVKFDAGGITAELTGVEQLTADKIAAQEAVAFDFPLGEAGGGVPSIKPQETQPLQNQAKLLVLAASKLGQPLNASDWCDTLKNSKSGLPEVSSKTVFALNSAVSGRGLTDIPADTVVFFETGASGWNQSGGAELLAQKSMGVAVAFADGRALLVDPGETGKLRWNP